MKGEIEQRIFVEAGSPHNINSRKRKLEKKWTVDEDHTMVQMIEDREAIWNTCSALYRNRDIKSQSWLEIAQRVDHSVLDAKNRWNIIKSRYNCERNKEMECNGKYQSKFELFEALQFLSTISKRNVRLHKNEEKIETKMEFNDTCYEPPLPSSHPYYSQSLVVENDNLVHSETSNDCENSSKRSINTPSLKSISSHSQNHTETTGYDGDEEACIRSSSSQNNCRNMTMDFVETKSKVSSEGRWKTVFAEYILCELDRYNLDDAQRLKTQLTKVCLDFQPSVAQRKRNNCCNCNISEG